MFVTATIRCFLPNKCQDLIQDRRFPDSDETRTSVNRIRHFNKNNLKQNTKKFKYLYNV